MPTSPHSAATQNASRTVGAVQKKAKRIFWQVLAARFLTPVLVTIAVNYYLHPTGKPRLEWSELWPASTLIALVIPMLFFLKSHQLGDVDSINMIGAKKPYQLLFCFFDEIDVFVDAVCHPPMAGFLGCKHLYRQLE